MRLGERERSPRGAAPQPPMWEFCLKAATKNPRARCWHLQPPRRVHRVPQRCRTPMRVRLNLDYKTPWPHSQPACCLFRQLINWFYISGGGGSCNVSTIIISQILLLHKKKVVTNWQFHQFPKTYEMRLVNFRYH